MIFQEPMTSLNPVFTVGDQIGEALMLHQSAGPAEADVAVEMLRTRRHPRAGAARATTIRTSCPAACASA